MSDVSREMRAITGTVSGRVQGVGFRMSTLWQAERLGVAGWVRNLSDGRVEVFVQGHVSAVDAMEEWLHDGPRGARVDHVSLVDVPPDPTVGSFRVR